jgi:hypothetical protein
MIGIRDEDLCKDDPCTCGAAIHDPAVHARTARIFRAARARRLAKEAANERSGG